MAFKRKLGCLMLISSHAFHATLPAPFSAAGWQLVGDSSFSQTSVNAVTSEDGINYVAVGDAGKIAYSANTGFTWQQSSSPLQQSNLYAAHYASGIYVVGGSAGKIATSTDKINWTLRSSGFGASPVLGITYFSSQNIWIAVGGSGKLATSPDAQTWTLRSSSFGVSYINTIYAVSSFVVAAGYDGKLATSTNGTSWTQRTSSFIFDTIHDISSVNTDYVAVGNLGKVATSADGLSWAQVFPGTSFGNSGIRAVSAAPEFYAAAGSLGKIATSSEGTSWIQRNSNFGAERINDLYVSDSSAVAVGTNGTIAYSV